MMILGTVFVVLCVCSSGIMAQDHGHTHPDRILSEKFRITVINSIGQATTPWDITSDLWKADGDVGVIVQAINIHYKQDLGQTGTLSGSGYLGLNIEHFVNGHSRHSWKLPRCTKPYLGKAIIRYTAGSKLTISEKDAAYDAFNACP